MEGDVPCAFPTLGETAECDALAIDVEAFLYGGDGLEDVHFAGPVPACAIDAAEAIELDLSLIGNRGIPRRPGPEKSVNELGLGGIVLASVQPDVETGWFRGVVILRQRDA